MEHQRVKSQYGLKSWFLLSFSEDRYVLEEGYGIRKEKTFFKIFASTFLEPKSVKVLKGNSYFPSTAHIYFKDKTSLWRTGSLTSLISQKNNNTLVSSHRQSISWSKNFLLFGKLWSLDTSGYRLSRTTKNDWHSHYYTITFHFAIFELWGLESEVGGISIQEPQISTEN